MSIATTCPQCEAFFRLSDDLAGKRVRCQKCQTRFIVPDAGFAETQPGTPVEAAAAAPAEAPPRPRPSSPPPAAPPADDSPDEEEDRPRKRRRTEEVDEDEDDRPRRRRRVDEDEDEDDEPRRRRRRSRKPASSSGSTLVYWLVGLGAALFLGCGGLGALIFFLNSGPNNEAAHAIVIGPNNEFRHNTSLTLFGTKKNNKRLREYSIPMEAGKTYEIDMISNAFDTYLVLTDEHKQVLAEDDDSGGNLNSRLIFTPQRAGTFHIEATTFDQGELGGYTLIVRRR